MRLTSRSLNVLMLASALTLSSGANAAALASTGITSNLAFCSTLAAKSQNVTAALKTKQSKVQQAWSNQDAKLLNLKAAEDEKITTTRSDADLKLQQAVTSLETKATTVAQKSAVKTFETTVSAALVSRRSAYDSARSAFRHQLSSTILAHRAVLKTQSDTFVQTIANANAAATLACSSGSASKAAVEADWVAKLRAAKESFVVPRADDSKIGDNIKPLVTERAAAFEAANTAFKSSLQAASASLKSVLPQAVVK